MKRQYIKLFCFMFGVSLIITSIVFVISNNFKESKQKEIDDERVIIDEIGDVYRSFIDKLEEFSLRHDSFIEYVDEKTTYFAIIPNNYQSILKVIDEYETYLVEIDDLDSYLENNCSMGKFYSDSETNKNCINYVRNMEKTINTYINDLAYFNHKIDEYNEWAEVENKSVIATVKYSPLDHYVSKRYAEYVDLDDDKTYLGAEID